MHINNNGSKEEKLGTIGRNRKFPPTKKALVKTQMSSKIKKMRERVNPLSKMRKEILKNQELKK